MSDKAPEQPALRFQAKRFVVLSAISFAGYLGLTALLHEQLGVSSYIAVPISMACITLFNFFTLKLFIFPSSELHWLKQLAGFITSIAGFRVAEYIAFLLLHGLIALPYLPAYATILGASAACKFLFLRTVLFAGPKQASVLPEPTP